MEDALARLKKIEWEQARAEYEVRGVSLGDVAKRFGVATSSVSRRASAGGWVQGKMQDLAERKVAAVKEFAAVETQMQDLPLRFRHTIQSVVQERLQAEGVLASLDVALASKAITLAGLATSPSEIEVLSRARKNLSPAQAQAQQTTVTVTQQAQAGATAEAVPVSPAPPTPDFAVRAVLRGVLEGDDV